MYTSSRNKNTIRFELAWCWIITSNFNASCKEKGRERFKGVVPVGLLQTVRREEVKVILSPLFVATSANSMGFTGKKLKYFCRHQKCQSTFVATNFLVLFSCSDRATFDL